MRAGAVCMGPESCRAGGALQSYLEGTGGGGESGSGGMISALQGTEGPSRS